MIHIKHYTVSLKLSFVGHIITKIHQLKLMMLITTGHYCHVILWTPLLEQMLESLLEERKYWSTAASRIPNPTPEIAGGGGTISQCSDQRRSCLSPPEKNLECRNTSCYIYLLVFLTLGPVGIYLPAWKNPFHPEKILIIATSKLIHKRFANTKMYLSWHFVAS